MTTEQLLAMGPFATALVAIVVAALGALVQWRSRIASDIQLERQRAADDKRLKDQREADEARWQAAAEVDARTRAEEHERMLQVREREVREGNTQMHADRLQADALDLLAIVGEALAAAQSVQHSLARYASEGSWDQLAPSLAPWTQDLRARLAVATAKVQLHDKKVAALAGDAQFNLTTAVEEMTTAYRANRAPETVWLGTVESDLYTFAAVVRARLRQLRRLE